ncbi:MAG: type 4a pilus biogenesis protein PilO [Candidatus Goldiibacteriota bacterium]
MDIKDLKNIKLTQKQQNQIAVVVLVVGLLGFGYFKYLLEPNNKKIAAKSKELKTKERELREARNMVTQYPVFLRRAALINRKVDFINKRLPADAQISEIIESLSVVASESGINLIEFVPGKEKKTAEYTEQPILLKFSAGYNAIGGFITRLGYMDRLATAKELRLKLNNSREMSGNNISAEVLVNIYKVEE